MSIVVMPDMIEVKVAVVGIEVDVVIAVELSGAKVLVSVVAVFSLPVVALVVVRDLYTRKMKMEIKLLVTILLPHC